MVAAATFPKLALAGVLFALAPITATITAPTHTPKINTHWNYTVRATRAGQPVKGTITAQIVDPIGGVHPVEYGTSTRKITKRPFSGVFRDFIIWPGSSAGITLKLRITLKLGSSTKVVSYAVTPHR
jgi:hypothetical protein